MRLQFSDFCSELYERPGPHDSAAYILSSIPVAAPTNLLLARLVQSNAELKAELAEIKASTAKTATNTRVTADAADEMNATQQQVVRGGLSIQTREAGAPL